MRSEHAPTAVALITRSTGELHCLLPILRLAKDATPELRIVVVLRDRSTRARIDEDAAYSAILRDLGAEMMHDRDLLQLALTRRRSVRLIFKEFGSTPSGTVPVLLKHLCPHAQLVLFPHAYALSASGQGPPPKEYVATRKDFDQDAIDALLVSSPLDVEVWSQKLEARKIQVVGATGYTQWWAALLKSYAQRELNSLERQARGKKIIFLTTRGPHDTFLTEENYQYLLHNALDAVLARPDTFVALKPHPREDIAPVREVLAKLPADRVVLTGLNTLAVASISALNLSFWSSAVLDAVAMGTPAIEFHRFHGPIPQSVIDGAGQVASIYTSLGVALKADSRESLERALATALDDRASLVRRQQAALAECFPENEAHLATLRGLLDALLRVPEHRTAAGTAGASWIRLARVSWLDLRQELRGLSTRQPS